MAMFKKYLTIFGSHLSINSEIKAKHIDKTIKIQGLNAMHASKKGLDAA